MTPPDGPDGRHAIVTGGSRGLGRSIALLMAARGSIRPGDARQRSSVRGRASGAHDRHAAGSGLRRMDTAETMASP